MLSDQGQAARWLGIINTLSRSSHHLVGGILHHNYVLMSHLPFNECEGAADCNIMLSSHLLCRDGIMASKTNKKPFIRVLCMLNLGDNKHWLEQMKASSVVISWYYYYQLSLI